MNFFSIDGHYSSNDFSEHFTLPTSSIKNPEFITLDELAKINKSIKLQDKKSKPFALKVTNKNEICVTKNQKTICLSDKDFKSVKESTMDISKEIARSRLKLLSPRDKTPKRRSLISKLSKRISPGGGSPRRRSPGGGSPRRRSPRSGSPRRRSPRSGSPRRRSPRSGSPRSGSPRRGSPGSKSTLVSSKSAASKPISFKDLLSERKTSKITSPTSVSSRSKTPDSILSRRRPSNSASSSRRPATNIAKKNTLPVNNLPNNKVIKQISSNVSSSKRR